METLSDEAVSFRQQPRKPAPLELRRRTCESGGRISDEPSMPANQPLSTATDADRSALLTRIAEALERLAPPPPPAPDFAAADAFVWRADRGVLAPVAR